MLFAAALVFTACDGGGGGGTSPGTGPGSDPGNGPGTGPGGDGPGTGPGTGPGVGTVWTAVPSNPTNNMADFSVRALAWGGNKFVAGGEGTMAYSSDGITWTAVADGENNFRYNGVMRDIAWGGGRFVAVGNRSDVAWGTKAAIAYSSDCITWVAVEDKDNVLIPPTGRSSISSIVYENGMFVAASNGSWNGSLIAVSTDGITWELVAKGIFDSDPVFDLAYGNGIFVAAGGRDVMAYSSDGEQWTVVQSSIFSSSNQNMLNKIAFGGGIFVAAGSRGTLAYSYDGETWTAVAEGNNPLYYPYKTSDAGYDIFASITYDINAITYGNGKFVAVNSGGGTAVSSDGVKWAVISDRVFAGDYAAGTMEATLHNAIKEIAYDGSKFIVMAGSVFIPNGFNSGIAYWDGN